MNLATHRVSKLDLFITNDQLMYSQHGVVLTDLSDHSIIFVARKKFKIKKGKSKVIAGKYKNFDEQAFIADLNRNNWEGIMNTPGPSAAWDKFVDEFSHVLDRHAPWKAMFFENDLPRWITREFLSSCRERDNLKLFSYRTKRPEDELSYNWVRNRHTQFARTLKRDYFINAFTEAGSESKKLWRLVRQLFGNPKSRNKIMQVNGKTSDIEIANEINNFFADIGPNLANDIPDSVLHCDYSFRGDYETFNFRDVTIEEFMKLMCGISVNKLTGVDGIPVCFLKMDMRLTSTIIAHIINLSLKKFYCTRGMEKSYGYSAL